MQPFEPRLLAHARSARIYIAATVALGWVTAILLLAQAFVLSSGITEAFEGSAGVEALAGLLSLLVLVVALRSAAAWAQGSLAHASSASIKEELRERLVARAVEPGPGLMEGSGQRELPLLVTRGLDALDQYFSRYVPQLVLALVVPITVTVVVASQDALSALILLVTLPLIPVFGAMIGWTTSRAQERRWQTLERLSGYFLDLVTGLPTLKVFGRAKGQTRGIEEVTDRYRSTTLRVLRISFLSSFALEVLSTISIALIAVSIGLRLVAGHLDLFTGMFVLVLAPEAYLPLRLLGQAFHASQDGLSAARRAFDVLDREVPRGGTSSEFPDPSATVIRLEDVSVTYSGRDHPALAPVSLAVAPGETVAFVGRTGAGKSTLFAVLLGLVSPTSGRVVLESEGRRVDLLDVDADAWRSNLAWVPQRPHLFAGSIADNVRMVSPGATDEEVRRALELAGADFVHRLPSRELTMLGDRGSGLSAGQRQRVAIARAFLRDRPILLLDEPTAGLDGSTEQRVLDSIRLLGAGKTVLIVAHRPGLVSLADRVVPLVPADDGGPGRS